MEQERDDAEADDLGEKQGRIPAERLDDFLHHAGFTGRSGRSKKQCIHGHDQKLTPGSTIPE
jgi:hypothetical protein